MATRTAPYPGTSRRVQGRLEALVRLAHGRLGRSYFRWLVALTGVLVITISVPIQNLTQVPLWTGDFQSWGYILIFGVLAAVSAPLVLGLVVVRRHRALVGYLRGDDVDPRLVWRDCVTRLPMTAALTTVTWGGFVGGVGILVVGRIEHFEVLTFATAMTSHALISIGAGAFYLMLFELALLPIAREVARDLPDGFGEKSPVTGRRRLILLNTAITFTVGCEAAGLSVGLVDMNRSWVVVLVTLGLVWTYVGMMLSLVSAGVTRRVDELADALNGVARGAVPMRILPTSGDEFDEAGRAFNSMVDLLEGHDEELRASRTRLVAVADATRRHIERDLHDGAQQNLALLSMQLGQLGAGCARLPELDDRVKVIRSDLSAVLVEMRALGHGIYPASLEAEGLHSALRAAARESEVIVTLDVTVDERWSHAVESAVYFCCWEVLQRARMEHAADPAVAITITGGDGRATVELAVQPVPSADHVADLSQFLQDRLGAVGGALVSAVGQREVVFVGEVPTR
jgi:signal transduction histidine kinase